MKPLSAIQYQDISGGFWPVFIAAFMLRSVPSTAHAPTLDDVASGRFKPTGRKD